MYVIQKGKLHYIFTITAFKICVDLKLKQNQSASCQDVILAANHISYQPF